MYINTHTPGNTQHGKQTEIYISAIKTFTIQPHLPHLSLSVLLDCFLPVIVLALSLSLSLSTDLYRFLKTSPRVLHTRRAAAFFFFFFFKYKIHVIYTEGSLTGGRNLTEINMIISGADITDSQNVSVSSGGGEVSFSLSLLSVVRRPRLLLLLLLLLLQDVSQKTTSEVVFCFSF